MSTITPTVTESAPSLPLPEIAGDFLLREDVAFFNHGSFGACPKPVFEAYQYWQLELERQPVDFLQRRARNLLVEARASLADYVGTLVENVVYVPNVTHAANFVAHSLELEVGDEVIGTDQEYGAVQATWEYVCQQRGARYVTQPMPLPVGDVEAFVERFWEGVTERTRVITMSHITSPTALIFPVAEICRRAREAGIITVIDGAHAVSQLELNLDALGADYYLGSCNKWLCGIKGTAFLYARPERQAILKPLIVNFGWKNRNAATSPLVDYFSWLGTDDPAAYLAVPAAIDYQRTHNWPAVRAACHNLARQIRTEFQELSGLPQICPDSPDWWMQVFSAPLPDHLPDDAHRRLWEEFKVEVPVGRRDYGVFIRVSVQAYNTPEQARRLVDGIKALLAEAA